ncbi:MULTISPECIES: enoyl-CoA hydratase/isomerase family protein [unclassified Curtobacterium]|uniref:enoyl-CoA hydratase/isomerase family protein n=1 Tax=unclassified Curtobacterium TaxID=257496 RepID=UPI000DA729FE|nr:MULTISPECIES: enoyl-CoA hydratase/isomerase family protein [unclassified Curtobacterium]PZF44635.1 enoyl-CoA hydratase/isomerase family protein [Curtobacterium sp. MCLR17_053]PZF52716.1 enoyl-CoA hydratase/isomerase family protein [Curtobacterium sp. MCLR17_051]
MPPVQFTRESPAVGRITFSNPPVGFVTGKAVRDLIDIVQSLASDDELKVLVFDSADEDYFLNHFDLAHLNEFPGGPAWMDLVVSLSQAPYVTIALIRGRTRGGGNELALALDLRYASRERALFGQPEVGTALVPGGGGTERLPRQIGRDRALEVVLTSADYDAETAERWGWVTRTLNDEMLDDYVAGVVDRLASFDRTALATAKAMVNRSALPSEAELESAYKTFQALTASPSFRARAASNDAPALTEEQLVASERNLGDFIGAAARKRAAAEAAAR